MDARHTTAVVDNAGFSRRLKNAMDALGLKQIDVCRMTGIMPSSMNSYLKKGYIPRMATVIELARVLNVNPADLFDVGGNSSVPSAPSQEESRLLSSFRRLGDGDRKLVIRLAESLGRKNA